MLVSKILNCVKKYIKSRNRKLREEDDNLPRYKRARTNSSVAKIDNVDQIYHTGDGLGR